MAVGRRDSPVVSALDVAVRSALDGLDLPVVMDVDCGHVLPQLSLVNGALARVTVTSDVQSIEQVLE